MSEVSAPRTPLQREVATEIPVQASTDATGIDPGAIVEWTVRRTSTLGVEPEDIGCGCGGGGGGGCGCSCV